MLVGLKISLFSRWLVWFFFLLVYNLVISQSCRFISLHEVISDCIYIVFAICIFVLNYLHVSTRLYQSWNFRTLDIQAARMETYESSSGADQIIIDLLSQLLKLGNKLAITPKVFQLWSTSIVIPFANVDKNHVHVVMNSSAV